MVLAQLRTPSSDGSFWTSMTPSGAPLYGLAAFAAVLAALMTPIATAVFVMWPPPYDDDPREVVPVVACNIGLCVVGVACSSSTASPSETA